MHPAATISTTLSQHSRRCHADIFESGSTSIEAEPPIPSMALGLRHAAPPAQALARRGRVGDGAPSRCLRSSLHCPQPARFHRPLQSSAASRPPPTSPATPGNPSSWPPAKGVFLFPVEPDPSPPELRVSTHRSPFVLSPRHPLAPSSPMPRAGRSALPLAYPYRPPPLTPARPSWFQSRSYRPWPTAHRWLRPSGDRP